MYRMIWHQMGLQPLESVILRPCAVPDFQRFVDAAGTPFLSMSEVIRLKHVAKIFLCNISSSFMSTNDLLVCCNVAAVTSDRYTAY